MFCGHSAGQGSLDPLSKAANNKAWSVLFSTRAGNCGSSPKENISNKVTPYDHTSERVENFPSLNDSGAYLTNIHDLFIFF